MKGKSAEKDFQKFFFALAAPFGSEKVKKKRSR